MSSRLDDAGERRDVAQGAKEVLDPPVGALNAFPPWCSIAFCWERIMKSSMLAALAMIIGVDTAAHADCVGSICLPHEQAASTQPSTEFPFERRTENALKDLQRARVDDESRTGGHSAWKQDQ
jgi:hypothetical protein